MAAWVVSVGVHAALFSSLRCWSPRFTPAPIPQTAEIPVEIEYEDEYQDRKAELAETTISPTEAPSEHKSVRLRSPRHSGSPVRPLAETVPEAISNGAAAVIADEPGSLAMRSREGESATSAGPSRAPDMAAAASRVASAIAGSADDSGDKQSPQARIERWERDAKAEANARAGDVPDVWRDVRHRIEKMFHPPQKVLRVSSAAGALGRQLLNTGGSRRPAPAGEEHPNELTARERSLAEDVMAGQTAAGRPAAWTRAEIVVEIGPDGSLRRAEIAASSGAPAFDKLALDAVCSAVAEHPILDGCRRSAPCTIRLRWAVEAALRVQPPAVMVPSDRRTGGAGKGITPLALRFSFDETKGSIRPDRPFESEILARVELIAIDRANGCGSLTVVQRFGLRSGPVASTTNHGVALAGEIFA